ncbi:MAG TPA: histone deacetylase family protein [Candidatus Bathyarchaeia archaeon]|nr:histone deacetylase family protein [Candidatus Bathyarchaeia archaeon]
MLKLVFHEKYLKYDFGPNHPWKSERSLVFFDKLKRLGIKYEVIVPPKARDKDILLVHDIHYLQKVKKLAAASSFLSADTPLNNEILEAAYFSVGGSIKTTELALDGEKVINLMGGFHHAGIYSSSGFCIFNDHAIAVRKLQKEGKIKKAMIYDLDVHAGQGTQEIFYNEATVFTISLHQDPSTTYPGIGYAEEKGVGVGEGYNLNAILSPGTGEKKYLKALDLVIPLASKYYPNLIVLVLGVDTYKKDPLAHIKLEIDSFRKIGARFKNFSKLAIMFAGGYSRNIADLWVSFLKGYL